MKDFQGFDCKTIIVVPNTLEYERRLTKRTQEEGVQIPPQAILDMKANFVLPDIEEKHVENYYAELNPKEAQEVIQKYNREALEAGVAMKDVCKKYLQRNSSKRRSMGITEPIGKLWTDLEQPSTSSGSDNINSSYQYENTPGASANVQSGYSRTSYTQDSESQRYNSSQHQNYSDPQRFNSQQQSYYGNNYRPY